MGLSYAGIGLQLWLEHLAHAHHGDVQIAAIDLASVEEVIARNLNQSNGFSLIT